MPLELASTGPSLRYGGMKAESTDPWDSRGAGAESSKKKEIPVERARRGSGFRGVTFPIAAPNFPVGKRGLEHGFRSFVEPAVLAAGQIMLDRWNGLWRAEVNVGGFPAHAIEESFFIAFGGQGIDFDVAAIGGQAAHDPVLREMDVGIADAHGTIHKFTGKDFRGVQMERPDPRGRSELLGFTGNVGTLPAGQSKDAGMAEAAQTGDAAL